MVAEKAAHHAQRVSNAEPLVDQVTDGFACPQREGHFQLFGTVVLDEVHYRRGHPRTALPRARSPTVPLRPLAAGTYRKPKPAGPVHSRRNIALRPKPPSALSFVITGASGLPEVSVTSVPLFGGNSSAVCSVCLGTNTVRVRVKRCPSPTGTFENSPGLQSWGNGRCRWASPVGTDERGSLTTDGPIVFPFVQPSLRDYLDAPCPSQH